MRALDLMADCLADVVEEAAAFGEHDIAVQLRCHQPCKMCDLDGVCKHVLPITRTVAHPPQQAHQLGMNAVNARLERRLLARLLDALIDLTACLLDHLLDTRRMNTPILDQLLKGDARHLAAHGIKPRKDDRFGRIIDDEVNAREGLKCANIASLTPNDAALHLVIRQCDDRNCCLCHMVSSAALDGNTQNLACCLVCLILRLLDVFLDLTCLLMLQLFLRLRHKNGARLLGGQPRDTLELLALALIECVDLRLCLVDTRLLARQAFLLLFDQLQFAVEILLLLDCAALHALQFTAPLLCVTLEVLPLTLDLLLGFKQRFLLFCLRRLSGLFDNPFCFTFG